MRAAASEDVHRATFVFTVGFRSQIPSRPGTKGAVTFLVRTFGFGHGPRVQGLDSDDDAQDPRIHPIASTVFFFFLFMHSPLFVDADVAAAMLMVCCILVGAAT